MISVNSEDWQVIIDQEQWDTLADVLYNNILWPRVLRQGISPTRTACSNTIDLQYRGGHRRRLSWIMSDTGCNTRIVGEWIYKHFNNHSGRWTSEILHPTSRGSLPDWRDAGREEQRGQGDPNRPAWQIPSVPSMAAGRIVLPLVGYRWDSRDERDSTRSLPLLEVLPVLIDDRPTKSPRGKRERKKIECVTRWYSLFVGLHDKASLISDIFIMNKKKYRWLKVIYIILTIKLQEKKLVLS